MQKRSKKTAKNDNPHNNASKKVCKNAKNTLFFATTRGVCHFWWQKSCPKKCPDHHLYTWGQCRKKIHVKRSKKRQSTTQRAAKNTQVTLFCSYRRGLTFCFSKTEGSDQRCENKLSKRLRMTCASHANVKITSHFFLQVTRFFWKFQA